MKHIVNVEQMTRGWFVGDFLPTAYATDAAEVGVKSFEQGATEDWHVHRLSTEITLVLSGQVRMGDHVLGEGDILVLEPGEPSDFEAITAARVVAVKVPASKDDKYAVSPPGADRC